jgi:hypothetical protein
MNDNALTESGWKSTLSKNKTIKDNGLQRALADFEDVDKDDHAAQLAAIAKVNKLAAALVTTLQKDKDKDGSEDVIDYLNDVRDAADARQKEISKAKVTADKAAAVAEKQEKEEDTFEAKLGLALQKLKSSRGLSYEFLVCEGPDGCVVTLAPAIQAQNRQQVMRLAGGRRLFGPGSCRFEDGKYVFAMERPPSGLAKKLQLSLLKSTGRRLPVLLGAESEDGEA